MSAIQGGWEAIVGALGGRALRLDVRSESALEALRREQLAEDTFEVEFLVNLLREHRVDVVRYFKDVIETIQLPELVVDDVAQDILLFMFQERVGTDWSSVTFANILEAGRCLILEKLMPQLRANFEGRFKKDKQSEQMLECLLEQSKRVFLNLKLDPFMQPDWRAILNSITNDLFKREFRYFARSSEVGASMLVCDGKVKPRASRSSGDFDNFEPEDASAWTNPSKLDAVLRALQSEKTNPDFRHCVYRQFVTLNEQFSDTLSLLSLQIWESVSTKHGALLHGLNHGAFRERCSVRAGAMLNAMRVCLPLLEREDHE